MKKIICTKCGEVGFYINFEIQKVYIAFDANGNEYDVCPEPVEIRSSIVNRCPYCERKVKIVEE